MPIIIKLGNFLYLQKPTFVVGRSSVAYHKQHIWYAANWSVFLDYWPIFYTEIHTFSLHSGQRLLVIRLLKCVKRKFYDPKIDVLDLKYLVHIYFLVPVQHREAVKAAKITMQPHPIEIMNLDPKIKFMDPQKNQPKPFGSLKGTLFKKHIWET